MYNTKQLCIVELIFKFHLPQKNHAQLIRLNSTLGP